MPLPRWAKRRIVRLHDQLNRALRQDDSPDNQHRVRILSKRMRYGIEALRTVLPKKRTQRWYKRAMSLQTTLGATRDVMQASSLAAKLEVNRALVEFLRGVAVGQERPR
jgi:CHAD domain-containing protein